LRVAEPLYSVMTESPPAANDCPTGLRMPAEWAPHRRSWMCWPCRLEAFGSADALARAKEAAACVAQAIARFEPVVMAARPEDAGEVLRRLGGAIEIFETPLDDSWARDTGPTFLGATAGIAWQFNAWGGKYHPYAEDRMFATRVLEHLQARVFRAPLVCEGGAIHVDGDGTLITTEQCLLNPNRNPGLSRAQVEEILARYTGVKRIVWLPGQFADEETDGHVDNIACFAAPGRIILGMPASKSNPDWEAVAAAKRRLEELRDAHGRAFEIVQIEQPRAAGDDWRGRPRAASYVNFCLANGGLVMPMFDDPGDVAAQRVLGDCFPGREIVPIDARDIVEGGGGIHCITQQEPQ
jgi:agmatine deiminase